MKKVWFKRRMRDGEEIEGKKEKSEEAWYMNCF